MEGKAVYTLETDREFKSLIRPLHDVEYNQLEENLLKEGCRDPIITWNNVIIDGHNRYEICCRHKIPFYVIRKRFQSREQVIAWICANQLGRRNLSEETRKYLIGIQYQAEKTENDRVNATGNNQYTARSDESPLGLPVGFPAAATPSRHQTAKRIGEENHIHAATVQKYSTYASAIDLLRDKVPDLASKILAGHYRISQANVIELATHSPEEIRHIFQKIQKRQEGQAKFRIELEKMTTSGVGVPGEVRTIKDMPEHDPDAEMKGLSLTIPSWRSSMERALRATDISRVTDEARRRVITALQDLVEEATQLIIAMEDGSNARL